MPHYKVLYFNAPGRAQTTRLMFVNAGVDFEDERLSSEEWQKVKPSTPLKQLPLLYVDGEVICQSSVIERYVAKVCGYYGSNDQEALLVEQLHTTVGELGGTLIPILFSSKSEEEKEEQRKEVVAADSTKNFFTYLTDKLKANNGGTGFLVGSNLSLADVLWYYICTSFLVTRIDTEGVLAKAYPELFALADRVGQLPNIKAYNEKQKK